MVQLNNFNDKIIQQHTGFRSINCFICYIIIINKGNIKNIMRTTTSCSWFEEWYLYLLVTWGRCAPHWYLVAHQFNIGETTARRIFDNKQQQVLDVMRDWPKYTSYKEDIHLQRETMYKQFFDNQRVIMWDMTI
jgi:hypothetical protein